MTIENKQKKSRKDLNFDQKLVKEDSQETFFLATFLTFAQTLSSIATTTMQALELYEVYEALSTMYNAYSHASSIY